MLEHGVRTVLLGVALVLAGACAPSPTPVAGQRESTDRAAAGQGPSRTVVLVIRGEPVSLASKQLIATGLSVRPASRLFNAELS